MHIMVVELRALQRPLQSEGAGAPATLRNGTRTTPDMCAQYR